ncbi:MAG: DUF3134 domain-containing protein [Hydrococcus sp. C42_A2020_068]|uniref:DUF3134 domain-containing protein n=1 Tax=Pleurocapsa sp. PCC 7327 TaxID=118163 RepID=UPI00029FCD4C|nr:DUF3134 domain-containing protein [Pleurocapsa sp. PCC 7327]AFY75840.1 Protein of unknown function (DUF3134) [Pleurocapsa sp. PCC 7327]MBF2020383.1 DUF3134 domain-containing protein [Hydrococcus sp. C42_A2020_068]
MHNPSLRQEPRYEPASVIPLKKDSSLIDWLKATGRLIERETVEETEVSPAEDEIGIEDFIDVDDSIYDDDDDEIELDIDED